MSDRDGIALFFLIVLIALILIPMGSLLNLIIQSLIVLFGVDVVKELPDDGKNGLIVLVSGSYLIVYVISWILYLDEINFF